MTTTTTTVMMMMMMVMVMMMMMMIIIIGHMMFTDTVGPSHSAPLRAFAPIATGYL